MADNSKSLLVAVSYSLPHIIAQSGGVIYIVYVGLLYINIYNWNPEEYGKTYALNHLAVSLSQFITGLLLQYVFSTRNEIIGLRNCKITQIINITAHSRKLFINTVSLFLLILLPILKSKYNEKLNRTNEDPEEAQNIEINDIQQKDENDKPNLLWKIFNTRWFFYIICLLSMIHGCSFGAYEIYDRVLPTYITKDSSYLSSTNDLVRGSAYLSAVLLVLLLTKLLKGKYPEYTPYLVISIILLSLITPISTIFYMYTQKSSTGKYDASNFVPTTAKLDYPVLAGLTTLETVYGIYYLTCPIVVQYISTKFLDNNSNFRLYVSTTYLISFFLGSVFYKAFSHITMTKKAVSYLCIACVSISYLLVFRHDYFWNKNGIIYYIAFAIFNIFIMIGFINSNIIITNQLGDDNHKKYRWLIQGVFYFIKSIILYFVVNRLYTTYDKEKESHITKHSDNTDEKETPKNREFKLNFSNIYIIIIFTCQATSAIGTYMYKEHKFK